MFCVFLMQLICWKKQGGFVVCVFAEPCSLYSQVNLKLKLSWLIAGWDRR